MAAAKRKPKESTPAKKRFWTTTRIGLTGAVIVLITAVASAFFSKEEPKSPASRPAAANMLPESAMNASFDLIDGNKATLADYAGKVVVLDLWATWCGPCRIEIPHLIEIQKEFKDKGLEVIGLTTENKAEDEEAVREFVKAFKIDYSIGWANREIAMNIMRGRGAIPQTLVIGRDGTIRKHLVGFNARLSPPQLRAAVEEAIAE